MPYGSGLSAYPLVNDGKRSSIPHAASEKTKERNFIVPKDGKIVFSLRCDDTRELDVGKTIAKELGGGGHKNAAGFTLPISAGLSFVDMLYA